MTQNLDYAGSGFINIPTSGASPTTNMQAMYYNYDQTTYGWNGYKYGLLYNHAALEFLIENTSTLFTNWHVPTSDELTGLMNAIGTTGSFQAGKAVDGSVATGVPSNWGGTDTYGFNLVPSGYYTDSGRFGGVSGNDMQVNLWSSTPHANGTMEYAFLVYKSYSPLVTAIDFKNQCAVRLVWDGTASYVGPGA